MLMLMTCRIAARTTTATLVLARPMTALFQRSAKTHADSRTLVPPSIAAIIGQGGRSVQVAASVALISGQDVRAAANAALITAQGRQRDCSGATTVNRWPRTTSRVLVATAAVRTLLGLGGQG